MAPHSGYSSWEMEVVQRLARIEQKQNYVADWIVIHDQHQAAMNARVSSLEQSRSRALGAIATISFLWAVILSAIGALWRKFGGS